MSIEKTLSIIKPDATARNITGQVNSIIEKSGLKIIAQKRIKLTKDVASKFYEVHKDRPFYKDLVSFMVSGPVVVQVLQGNNAVALYRQVMGSTNPEEAEEGTIRKNFASNVQENAVHGSDSNENAEKEIAFFFLDSELLSN